jgi:hypothetical protein
MSLFIKSHHTGRIQIYNYIVAPVAASVPTVVNTKAMKPFG